MMKGTLKTYTVDVESGNTMTSFFCGDCGSTLYRKSSHSDAAVVVMLGCINDKSLLDNAKPETGALCERSSRMAGSGRRSKAGTGVLVA